MKWVGIGLELGQLVPDRRFEVVGAIVATDAVQGVFVLSVRFWGLGAHWGKCLEFGWGVRVCRVCLFFTKIWVGAGCAPLRETQITQQIYHR